jgi:magnesium transporter
MKFFNRNLTGKIGLPPGEIIYTGIETKPTSIQLYKYDPKSFERVDVTSLSDINFEDSKVNWMNISGFENQNLISEIISLVGIHNLLAEDIFNMDHMPKLEEHEESILFIVKNYITQKNKILQNHCSIYLKDNIVISFQELPNNFLDKKIERISMGKGKARFKNADYMFFVLLDAFIDSYYTLFEEIREEISRLEESLLKSKKNNRIGEIYDLNTRLTYIRKEIFPLKEALRKLQIDDVHLIAEENNIYFNDAVDHINELMQFHESFGGLVRGLIDLNENNMNSNTNEVMKVLTIIASIFIPLSFIAGVYGMNFENMPELKLQYGYFFILGLMLITAVGLIIFMKIKKWF